MLKEKYIKYEFNQIPPPVIVDVYEHKSNKKKERAKIVKVECGTKHTLLVTSSDLVYGFGDNSHGQIMHDGSFNEFVVKKPKLLRTMAKFKQMITKIHAADKMSLMTYDNGKE
jgi:alpha-tubulin suppressor-like RCC1 family protein